MELHKSLRRFREQFKLTQDEVARKMEVSRTMYQAYERGESAPSVKKLITLADDCNISLDYLAGRADEPKPTEKPVLATDDELIQAAIAFATVLQKKFDQSQNKTQNKEEGVS